MAHERGLYRNGKKIELIKRLQDYEKECDVIREKLREYGLPTNGYKSELSCRVRRHTFLLTELHENGLSTQGTPEQLEARLQHFKERQQRKKDLIKPTTSVTRENVYETVYELRKLVLTLQDKIEQQQDEISRLEFEKQDCK